MFKLGLVINPYAGVGGRVGFKGSDGDDIREKALAVGGKKLAESKAITCLQQFSKQFSDICIYTSSGNMGAEVCEYLSVKYLGVKYQVVHHHEEPSSATDTQDAIQQIQMSKVDLLLFVGGDGTARNISEVSKETQVMLGIPAGVKIHSGVYAVSPEAAGLLVSDLINGTMLSLTHADVVDLDEGAFRRGRIKSKHYGELLVPASLEYVQSVKQGHQEIETLVLDDIAADIIETMEDDEYYVIGSGTTCAAIMDDLKLPNTLLGSDIIFGGKVIIADAIEKDFLRLINDGLRLNFILTVIGGQGHILGRGNPQISPEVIKKNGWDNFHIIATKTKLKELPKKRLLVDTGDTLLDHQLFGPKRVITGYKDYVLFPVGLK